MKIKELRKGNIIQFIEDASLCIVKGIDADGLGLTVFSPSTTEETWIEFSQFEGLPITKDVLFFLGCYEDGHLICLPHFIKEKCTGDNGFKCSSFFFNTRDDINSWMDTQTRVCVKYAHDVQNLVYWLTREEIPVS